MQKKKKQILPVIQLLIQLMRIGCSHLLEAILSSKYTLANDHDMVPVFLVLTQCVGGVESNSLNVHINAYTHMCAYIQ